MNPLIAATVASGCSSISQWPELAITCAVTLFCSSLYYVYIVQVGLAYTAIGVTSPDQIGSKIGFTRAAADAMRRKMASSSMS